MRLSRRPNGFSLIEIMISIVLVGLSITALVLASNSLTMANGAGADLSTAEFLIEQIRELTAMIPPTELNGLVGEHSPPISAAKTDLNDFPSFTQQVVVQKLNRSDLDQVATGAEAEASPFFRVTVTIMQNNKQVSSASWIRAKY